MEKRFEFKHDDLPDLISRLAAYEDIWLEPCDYAAMRSAMDQAEGAKQQLSDVVSIRGAAVQSGGYGMDKHSHSWL